MPIIGILASAITNNLWPANSYESIATVTVGVGGASAVDFGTIPSDYTHLQIRGIGLSSSAGGFTVQFNNDTSSNYSWHQMWGDGSMANSNNGATQSFMYMGFGSGTSSAPNTFVTDVLNYRNTNTFKTLRGFSGNDTNGSGYVQAWSGNWRSNTAITSIKVTAAFNQHSQLALYGIKAA